ncbi:MAG: helix-hairpin-helix domain-containing protein [Ignavibacteriae bacterium]|nr:helix-hairpin-helix domain-containing protein [Ignavibacteriota bacterium]
MSMSKHEALKQLQEIPGVGISIAEDLWELGIRSIPQLKGKNPERLYYRRCEQQGVHIDRCLLYVFRCAVYYASHARHKPELLKWWNWKD